MTVSLNIADDSELRNYIKDMVKGQVLAVTREEVHAIVTEEVTRKLKGLHETTFNQMMKSAMTSAVGKILNDMGHRYFTTELIKPYVEEVMQKTISHDNWMKLVRDVIMKNINTAILTKLAEE